MQRKDWAGNFGTKQKTFVNDNVIYKKEIFIQIKKLYHYVSLQFNMEETAFEWELTNYPLMQATVDKLNPFLNLYETSMEFMNKQKTWFESPMGTHDPKVIIKE